MCRVESSVFITLSVSARTKAQTQSTSFLSNPPLAEVVSPYSFTCLSTIIRVSGRTLPIGVGNPLGNSDSACFVYTTNCFPGDLMTNFILYSEHTPERCWMLQFGYSRSESRVRSLETSGSQAGNTRQRFWLLSSFGVIQVYPSVKFFFCRFGQLRVK